jgi:hypothetical protein
MQAMILTWRSFSIMETVGDGAISRSNGQHGRQVFFESRLTLRARLRCSSGVGARVADLLAPDAVNIFLSVICKESTV